VGARGGLAAAALDAAPLGPGRTRLAVAALDAAAPAALRRAGAPRGRGRGRGRAGRASAAAWRQDALVAVAHAEAEHRARRRVGNYREDEICDFSILRNGFRQNTIKFLDLATMPL